MPELPEVETVKTQLEKKVIGKTFSLPHVYFEKRVRTPLSSFKEDLEGKKILSLSRRGKYLLFHLSDDRKLIFHLRMEGKLYLVDKEHHSSAHLSLFLPFQGKDDGLAFYDVRKFGVVYYLKEKEEGPLSVLGKEPFEIHDCRELYQKIHKNNKRIKEVLLDQSIRCGIGNIYADEICFYAKVAPFKKASSLSKEEVRLILEGAQVILKKAIDYHGSTVRSYRASQEVKGEFQDFLSVYSREGKECLHCKKAKIRKRSIGGRGTSFCPHCQSLGLRVGVTGKIASGKSLATSYFGKHGFLTLSCDEIVHSLYKDERELNLLKKKFPRIFTPSLNKEKITLLLKEDSVFKRSYLSYINHLVKDKIIEFRNKNYDKNIAVEVPLLFDSHRQNLFQYLVGVETTKQLKHLLERGGNANQLLFNERNSYDKHRQELDYILKSDGTKKELENQVVSVIKDRKEKQK